VGAQEEEAFKTDVIKKQEEVSVRLEEQEVKMQAQIKEAKERSIQALMATKVATADMEEKRVAETEKLLSKAREKEKVQVAAQTRVETRAEPWGPSIAGGSHETYLLKIATEHGRFMAPAYILRLLHATLGGDLAGAEGQRLAAHVQGEASQHPEAAAGGGV
jgi:hypothetical protein